jgi:hypothetical protein
MADVLDLPSSLHEPVRNPKRRGPLPRNVRSLRSARDDRLTRATQTPTQEQQYKPPSEASSLHDMCDEDLLLALSGAMQSSARIVAVLADRAKERRELLGE